MTEIKDIVKYQQAHFVFYRDQCLFYETDVGFQFPCPIEGVGTVSLGSSEKAILLMRYIKESIGKIEKVRELGSTGRTTYNNTLKSGRLSKRADLQGCATWLHQNAYSCKLSLSYWC